MPMLLLHLPQEVPCALQSKKLSIAFLMIACDEGTSESVDPVFGGNVIDCPIEVVESGAT